MSRVSCITLNILRPLKIHYICRSVYNSRERERGRESASTIKIMDSSCQTVLPPGGVISSRHDKEGDNRSSVKVFLGGGNVASDADKFLSPPLHSSTLLPPSLRRGERYQRLGIVGMHQAVGNFPTVHARNTSTPSFPPPPFNPGWPLRPLAPSIVFLRVPWLDGSRLIDP